MKIKLKTNQEKQRKLEHLTLFKSYETQQDALYLKVPGGAVNLLGEGYFSDEEHGDDDCVVLGQLEVEL